MSNPARQLMNLPPVTMHMVMGGEILNSVRIEEVLAAVIAFTQACVEAEVAEVYESPSQTDLAALDKAAWEARAAMLAMFGVREPERQDDEER